MTQHRLDSRRADVALSDMPVPVYMTSEGRPCIIEVDQVEP